MKKSVLCLALSLALVLAFAPVRAAENMPEADSSKANPVDQLTGAMWQKTPEAAAGPRDGQYLFGRFRQLIGEAAGA